MTIKLPANVIHFANDSGMNELLTNYIDLWNHYQTEFGGKNKPYIKEFNGKTLSYAEKEKAVNAMMVREVGRLANFDLTSQPIERLVGNNTISWAVGNISSQMIDAILPQTMVEATGPVCDIKVVGIGETAIFDIKSRDLFRVTKSGRGMREAEVQKGFEKQVTLYPEPHMVTVGVNLFRVLAGQESLAEFTMKALRSIESEFTKDIWNAFVNTMSALSTDATTGLQVSGYTQADLTNLAQKVQAYSGGAKPVVLGTKLALAKILPDDTNTRADYASDYVKVGYVRTISGIDTIEIPQVADWVNPFATLITNNYLWIVAPGTDKIIKGVLAGSTLSRFDEPQASAMLLQNATFTKYWNAGFASSSIGATIALP